MIPKLVKREFFQDRPLFLLAGLSLLSLSITLVRVLSSVRQYNYKITVRYSQYGADSFLLGDWYALYDIVIFGVITTIIAIALSMRLHGLNRTYAYLTLILHHIVLIFLFLVANALLGTTSVAS